MKISKLHLTAFGPFTDRELDFGTHENSVVFIHGQNEAGKSSTLRAISDLRYGIPQQSRDNFLHVYRDMQLGGVFVDRQNKEYCVTRRKGRNNTLTFATGLPVPTEIEALITGGLAREEYETMFGLDHQRLRTGGAALLDGEGEIGAALFEASSGVRSIASVMERLDQSARTYLMPGTRGKNARINEALRHYSDHMATYKTALVKPAAWAELFKQHQIALTNVADIERRQREVHGHLRKVTELRAVAPLIRALDAAHASLSALESAMLLPETAPTERAGAEAGLSSARHNANVAKDRAASLRQQLEQLVLDTAVLDVAPAIERLAASAETIDTLRKDIAEAGAEVAADQSRIAALAAAIHPDMAAEEALALAPGATAKASIEQLLRELELAQHRLDQHKDAAAAQSQADSGADASAHAPPAPEVRTALRSAQLEVTRHEAGLQRKVLLPAEIRAIQRSIKSTLAALGLADETALSLARPVLESEIEAARKSHETNATERQALRKRISEIHAALDTSTAEHERLLADGDVPTMDAMLAARERRDLGWSLVRAIHVERQAASDDAYTGGNPLVTVYEEDVRQADRLADLLASDTERATQLQACLREITKLEHDLGKLRQELASLDARQAVQERAWAEKLAAHHLPALTPAALREWQILFAEACALREALQVKLDEQAAVEAIETRLTRAMHAAILGTGVYTPAADAGLDALSSIASDIEEEFKQRERAFNTAAGKRLQREEQVRQLALREKQFNAALAAAQENVQPAYAALHLPPAIGVAAARARLLEFETLVAARTAMDACIARQSRAQGTLDAIVQQCGTLALAVNDAPPADVRLYVERLLARLRKAKETETAHAIAQQNLAQALASQQEHEETAARHARTLTMLCEAANVAVPAQLPEAEERSRRKREAQADADRTRKDLASASPRAIAELRELLRDYDTVRMDAEETGSTQELTAIEERMLAARQAEESARRQLEAINSADTAAAARENMERAAATVRTSIAPWMRSKLAHALLGEALKRFRERAQGPMLQAASAYFMQMTDGHFVRLVSDDSSDAKPVLLAQRANGTHLRVEEMSEGTRDQLYLALRLAALEIRRSAGVDLPVVLDDVLMTSDDARAGFALKAISDFSKGHQVIVFTHHRHLVDVAKKCVAGSLLAVVSL